MPSWNELLNEIKSAGSTHDLIRRKYLAELHKKSGRNVIVYYSGWLQKAELQRQGFILGFQLNDADKNGFMSTIHGLDRKRGLDLILHTPGGETAATESIVDYLRRMFDIDIRAIVPQLAMSAGTMVALACKEIIMGKHSSLGPIDPQIGGLAAHGIIEEFKLAADEIQKNPARVPVWQPIIAKYNPTLIGEAQKAIDWSNEMVKEWLVTAMFKGDEKAKMKADRVVLELGDHAVTKSHARHISITKAQEMGLKVGALEDSQEFQEAVLSVHHACIQTLEATGAYKIIENHNGVAYVQTISTRLVTAG